MVVRRCEGSGWRLVIFEFDECFHFYESQFSRWGGLIY
jgi:hypothetical protein